MRKMMVSNYAKFSATMGKGLKVGESEVEIKLTLPLKIVQEHFMFLSTNQGEKINVFLGDPQMAFDFEEDKDPMYQKLTGRYVTTDSSGVVTRVEKPDGEDENQTDLFDQESETEDDTSSDEQKAEVPPGDEVPDPDQAGSGLDEDVPDWMKGIDDKGEMDFTEGSSQESGVSEGELTDYEREIMGESSGDQPDGAAEISKEQLEEYILQNRPVIPDMEFNFPELLEKRYQGTTWMTLSKELGVSSGQLSTKFKKYKEEVEKLMKGDGAA